MGLEENSYCLGLTFVTYREFKGQNIVTMQVYKAFSNKICPILKFGTFILINPSVFEYIRYLQIEINL